MEVSSDDDGYENDHDLTWVQRYTAGVRGHEMILEVPNDYISNEFNTQELEIMFNNFEELRD